MRRCRVSPLFHIFLFFPVLYSIKPHFWLAGFKPEFIILHITKKKCKTNWFIKGITIIRCSPSITVFFFSMQSSKIQTHTDAHTVLKTSNHHKQDKEDLQAWQNGKYYNLIFWGTNYIQVHLTPGKNCHKQEFYEDRSKRRADRHRWRKM